MKRTLVPAVLATLGLASAASLALSLALLLVSSLALSLAPSIANAQQPPGFDPAQMQEMMKKFQDPAAMQKLQQQAEAASRCMEGIDENKLRTLQSRAEAAGKEIDELCAAGKKDEALRKGLTLSRELQNDATVKKLRVCSEELGDAMKDLPWASMSGIEDLESDMTPTSQDICS